jgi:hypothetical protein
MRCEFNDGMKISYTGRLRITKGDEVNIFLDQDDIPVTLQGRLHDAGVHDDCGDLRSIADEVTDMFGTKLPEH